MDPIEDSDRDEPMWDENDGKVERVLNSLASWTHQPISPKHDAQNLGLELGLGPERPGKLAPPMANGRGPSTLSGGSLTTGLPPWARSGSPPPSPSHNHGPKHSTQPEIQFANDHAQRVLEDDDLMMRNCSMRRYQESLSPSFPDCKPDLWNVIRASTSGDTAMSSRRPPTLKTESKRGQRPLRSYRSMGTLTLNSSASSQHGRGPGPIRNVRHRRNVAISISRGKHSDAFGGLSSSLNDQLPPLSFISTHVHPQLSLLNAFNDRPVSPLRLIDDAGSRMSRSTATSSLCNRVKSALVAALHPIGQGRESETGEPAESRDIHENMYEYTFSKGRLESLPEELNCGTDRVTCDEGLYETSRCESSFQYATLSSISYQRLLACHHPSDLSHGPIVQASPVVGLPKDTASRHSQLQADTAGNRCQNPITRKKNAIGETSEVGCFLLVEDCEVMHGLLPISVTDERH
ncbi:hypothetical protein FRC17_004864 [Serendipita sp. 399]|nr:hypothetical protein FRC17_004864 [Serendipita sp. 399]